jgi:hypothetical protein
MMPDDQFPQLPRYEIDDGRGQDDDDQKGGCLRIVEAADRFKEHLPDSASADKPENRRGPYIGFKSGTGFFLTLPPCRHRAFPTLPQMAAPAVSAGPSTRNVNDSKGLRTSGRSTGQDAGTILAHNK